MIMKFKFKTYILYPFISAIFLLVAYNLIKPIIINKLMGNNYYSNEKEFVKVTYFISQNESELFTKNEFPPVRKDTTTNKVKKQLRDSLYNYLKIIKCEAVINLGTSKDSVKTYFLIYHQEFLFPTYVYLIGTGNNKPLKEIISSDEFIEYHWLDNNVLAGTIKWN
jgi:hypothetical protein